MNSKFTKILLVIAIIVFVVAGYLFLSGKIGEKNKPMEESANSTVLVEETITDWKTYKNEKHGIEFSYPANLTVEDNLKPYGCVFVKGNIGPNISRPYLDLELCAFSLDTYDSSVDFVKWVKNESPEEDEVPGVYNFKIGEIDAVKTYHPKSPQTYSDYSIYFLKDKRIYKILLNDIEPKESQDLYNQILSTFKFKESLSVW